MTLAAARPFSAQASPPTVHALTRSLPPSTPAFHPGRATPFKFDGSEAAFLKERERRAPTAGQARARQE